MYNTIMFSDSSNKNDILSYKPTKGQEPTRKPVDICIPKTPKGGADEVRGLPTRGGECAAISGFRK